MILLALAARGAGLTLPLSDPSMVFALAMLLFLAAPLVFQRIRLPGIVSLIVAGAVVGPHGLGLLERDETIVLLGTVGLLYLMLMAGVEIDLQGFARHRRRSLAFGAATFLLPQVLGTGVGLALGYGWAASILMASMFASHTLVAYPIASRLGIARNAAVTATIGGTIVTDLAALLVLAVVAASREGALDAAFWLRLGVSMTVFAALVLLVLPRIGYWFFRNESGPETSGFLFVLTALFVSASLAHLAGVEPIIGAFLAGLAINRFVPEGSPLNNRLHFFGNAFFIPFFLFSVGMLVDVRVLAGSAQAWRVMIGMTATVIATKWAAARIAQWRFGYTAAEGWTMFGLSVAQAAATLAAALIGYRIELFDDAVLNGAILMIVVTCVVGPAVVERFGRRVALEEEERPYDPAESPQRILVPIANPDTEDVLLELATLIRDPLSDEPLLPITVVHGDGKGSAERVAAAERMLGRAVAYGAGAGVPVIPLTRLDRDPAGGIVRGMAESRTSTVVLGWDGKRKGRGTVFGPTLDRLLESTDQLLLVARCCAEPLNTTRRVVLVLPPRASRSAGFYDAVRTVKTMASRLGAPLLGLVIEEDPAAYEARLALVRPEVATELRRVRGWRELDASVRSEARQGDLVMVIGARRGAVAWHRDLDHLPARFAESFEGSLVFLYPTEIQHAPHRERRSESALPRTLTDRRVVFDLPALPFGEAVERLLRTEFAEQPDRLAELRRAVLVPGAATTVEIVPGVAFTSARAEGLREPLVFLGISPEGLRVPEMKGPARLLFLQVSPKDRPAEHLENLSAVAEAVRDRARLEELWACRTPDDLYSWFRVQASDPAENGARTPAAPAP